jgi:HD-like signal output (HDOD) protein/GGDEF domain-containing protein
MKKTNIAIERLVEHARQLHTLPAVAMEVLELTNNPVVDAQALKKCIECDAALTTKLLRVVNSSLFGLSREVSDLNQALALLGTKPLKLLVLGFSLPSGLFGDVGSNILEHYWRHTLIKAVAAREISQTIWNRPGDDAFIAGLLQDIGEMLLVEELGTPYVRLLEKSFSGGVELRRLEVEAMGFDHTELTSRLLEHWRLPAALVRAVRWDIDKKELARISPGERAERRILHLAELVARLLADGDIRVLGKLIDAGRDKHNLSKRRLDMLVADLEEKVDSLAEVLSLRLGNGPDESGEGAEAGDGAGDSSYMSLLRRAHEQLAAAADSAAEDMLAARLGIDAASEAGSGLSYSTGAMALADELRSLSSAVNKVVQRDTIQTQPAKPQPAKPHPLKPSSVESGADRVTSIDTGGDTSTLPSKTITVGHGSATAAADPVLLGRLADAVSSCRRSRCGLSLLMVELNYAAELKFAHSMDGYIEACRLLATACGELDFPGAVCVPVGEAAFAVILPDCDRREVAAPAHELIEAVAGFDFGGVSSNVNSGKRRPALTLGVGAATVAMPPKNFPSQSLIESAARCLYGSSASGGGVLKSIEIY